VSRLEGAGAEEGGGGGGVFFALTEGQMKNTV